MYCFVDFVRLCATVLNFIPMIKLVIKCETDNVWIEEKVHSEQFQTVFIRNLVAK